MPNSASSVKCAHPACECTIDPKGEHGKYCSGECRRAGSIAELHCNCQHVECRQHGQAVVPIESSGLRP